jgi:pantoate--beta-alanine ligase
VIELATVGDVRGWSRAQRTAGRRVGFVPTMGFLHEGHLLLVDRARAATDVVVMSIFVNPLQFGPTEDLGRYPRDLARDRALAAGRGVACLYVPTVDAMYPTPALVRVTPGPLADHLCGPRRPGHFEGVLTVVAKLLHQVEPDVALFGRKDVQQARLVQRMVADLDLPVTVVIAPTAREPDGLALSSRNTYLTPDERRRAARLPAALGAAHRAFEGGERSAATVCRTAGAVLAGDRDLVIEYVEAVHPATLAPVETVAADTVLAAAVQVGRTRLIDNIVLGEGLAGDPVVSR